MAFGDGSNNIDFRNNYSGKPEQEIIVAIDQVHIALSNMSDVLRHPTLGTTLSDDLQSRRRAAVRAIIRIRDIRDNHLGTDLFNDPAWNILLDCYACELDGRSITVSDACVASGAPYTTALRWLRALEDRGLIERKDDTNDRRRAFIVLTPEARTTVETLIDRAMQSLGGHASQTI